MIKIGDFSKLSLVSVKTLRYYDETGLLSPIEVDRSSGYRYYSLDQLPRLNRIRNPKPPCAWPLPRQSTSWGESCRAVPPPG